MAFTDRDFTSATGQNKSAGSAVTCTPSAAGPVYAAAGDVVVVMVACDSIAGGTAISSGNVTDSPGNTYTMLLDYDPANAAGLPAFAIFYSVLGSAHGSGSNTVTFTPSSSSAAKAMSVRVFSKAGTVSVVSSSAVTASGATTAVAVTNGGTLQSADLVVAGMGVEGVFADMNGPGDSDASNGSWADASVSKPFTLTVTSGGGTTSNIGVRGDYKLVTAAGNQTWNNTLNNARDWGAGIVALRDTVTAATALPVAHPARRLMHRLVR